MRDMPTLPADAREPGAARLTGLTCPECPGTLTVEAEGRDNLVFVCRVGHTYAAEELIGDKEKRAERLLWAAVEALEELGALLRDLGVDDERARRAHAEAAAVRRIIATTVPVNLALEPACAAADREG